MKTSVQTFQPPSPEFIFGTDDLGRDVFSGVIHGARFSLSIGIIVALLSGLVGVLIGLVSGYAGGLTDDLLMRLTETFLVPPRFFLAVVIAAIFGSSFLALILVLSVTYWPMTARLVRAEVMSLKQRGFVEASRALGASPARILFHEILPNALPLIVTNIMLKLGGVIMVEAGLEFLGLGDANRMSWGYMLHSGQHYMRDAWWMVAFPSLAISLLILALNLVGDELNRALNPRLRTQHKKGAM
jgi:peptide/nickel transport system permease protein